MLSCTLGFLASGKVYANNLPPSHIRYTISATLNPADHYVEGEEEILWTNRSGRAVTVLYLHLYLNAFRDNRSVFMKESGGQLREQSAIGAGRIDILSMRTSGGQDLLSGAQNELIEGDFTQMRVPLISPVLPAKTLRLKIRFVSTLPELFARAGYVNDFHMVAQWYPKLAKLEDDGHWTSFPYHGLGEFFSDFADHEVTVRAPSEYVIAGSGDLVSTRREGSMQKMLFRANAVHDIAFAAYPHFKEWVVQDSHPAVRFFAPLGYESAVFEQAKLVTEGLRYFGARYGTYPYSTLTVVIPPRGAEGVAAMEYPTLIVSSGPWVALPGWRALGAPGVVAHELAHQWFYGLIGSNEVRWPVLDEGISEWAALDMLRHIYGSNASGTGWPLVPSDAFHVLYPFLNLTPRSDLAAYRYSEEEYSTAAYVKPAAIFETVRRVWGDEAFLRALGRYARTERFRHPEPEALYAAFDAEYWFGFSKDVLVPMLSSTSPLDYKVTRLAHRPQHHEWLSEIRLERDGVPSSLPVWVNARTHEGDSYRFIWRGDAKNFRISHIGPSKITQVHVDPSRRIVADRNPANNDLPKVSSAQNRYWWPWLMLAAQLCLGLVGL
ncbi:MAG: M1 family metallopeptidase [Myxococcales bacterium]|nr:M1 family metallopeptidase [Myxococcales bacterium]